MIFVLSLSYVVVKYNKNSTKLKLVSFVYVVKKLRMSIFNKYVCMPGWIISETLFIPIETMKYSKECGTLARDTYGGPDPLIRVLPSRRSPQYGGWYCIFIRWLNEILNIMNLYIKKRKRSISQACRSYPALFMLILVRSVKRKNISREAF